MNYWGTDAKMTKITEGLQCLRCYSFVFTIDNLVSHINDEPTHNYWKYGEAEGGVVFIKLFNDKDKED